TGAALGGATFEVCRTHSYNPTTKQFTDIPDQCRTVPDNVDGSLDTGDVDLDPRPGEFEIGNILLGRYTIRETVPPPGFGADPDVVTVDFTGGTLRVEVLEAFVDGRPIVKLVEFGYTNTPTGIPTAGVVSGTTVFTARLKNFGTATAVVSGTLAVTASGQGAGTFTCTPSCTVTFTATLAPGAGTVVTLTFTYADFADGAQVRADLSASYTTPPDTTVVREASGSPAVIMFTVQGD
ncbi:MAG TPA: SpaA isopeptide-forming pilin-related protein, partial [Thermoplasmata archaeon]|nr:SpaA isopeptide-forming pilin-related protein [Thermoplasmata archaeon]